MAREFESLRGFTNMAKIQKRVYQLRIVLNGEEVFNRPVSVRRQSELNSVISNYKLDIGDKAEIYIERSF